MRRGLCTYIVIITLVLSVSYCLNRCQGCLEEERRALLDIKDSINYPNGSPLSGVWVEEDCCEWHGVSCNSLTSRVVSLGLYNERKEELGTWYPNATLFAKFKELETLALGWNQIGGWVMPHELFVCLDLSNNNLDNQMLPPCLLKLPVLEELYLSWNSLRNLTGFPQMPTLKTLYLSGNKLNESIHSLSDLCRLRNLRFLDLSDNNLDNQIPLCLQRLSLLEDLDLSENSLRNLTGLCGLKNLKTLDLDFNNLDDQRIPPCIGNLSALEHLSLSYNNLQVPFGTGLWDNDLKDSNALTGLCNLRNLGYLNLRDNSIEGSIPPCFGNMHSLTDVYLSNNRFRTIPPFIFNNLTMVSSFDISDNQLIGEISFSMFANLSKLDYIDLSNNAQSSVLTEFPHWIPTFQLTRLRLINCNLNKHNGHNIPSFISTQYKLNFLYLDGNHLKGSIPSRLLYNIAIPMTLSLRDNWLEGPFPQSPQQNTSGLVELDISNNFLHGSLPTNVGLLLPNLIQFNMSTNDLQGQIPISLIDSPKLATLDLSNNSFSGVIPHSLTQNHSSLKYLSLSNNHLEGQIPGFNATKLVVLLLNGNRFTGTIPSSLLSSPNLMFLDVAENKLSGPIPRWFSSLPNLVSLLLGSNYFEGRMPTQLCQMQNLHTLDLSDNYLSGGIPSCLSNVSSWTKPSPIIIDNYLTAIIVYGSSSSIKSIRVATDFTTKGASYSYEGLPLSLMTGIDLSVNQLTGKIPFQMGDLRELHSLNFSHNFLTGPLPESFQNLKNMESLDLSHNKLVGMIPPQLVQLTALSMFSVAFNNLSGRIPSENQFQTFPNSSYTDNPFLCGPPLERNCSVINSTDSPHEEEGSRILDNTFYLWVAMSYALGLWGFIALLLFNKNWRWNYFRTVDGYIDDVGEKLWKFKLFLKKSLL